MDRMLYVAMSGASDLARGQAIVAHNLANLSTVGFKAMLQAARSVPVTGEVYPSRVYARVSVVGPDLSPGPLVRTGRDLDVAVEGEGWIAVQAPDGSEAYTRAGDLRIGPGGVLMNGAGHPVLGSGGPIAIPPYETLQIGADGTITIRPLGQGANALTVLDRIRLVRPPATELVRGPDGLFRLRSGGTAPPDASVRLVTGSLEQSNVHAIGALVDMIDLARRYELQVRLMQTARENDQAASQLLRLG